MESVEKLECPYQMPWIMSQSFGLILLTNIIQIYFNQLHPLGSIKSLSHLRRISLIACMNKLIFRKTKKVIKATLSNLLSSKIWLAFLKLEHVCFFSNENAYTQLEVCLGKWLYVKILMRCCHWIKNKNNKSKFYISHLIFRSVYPSVNLSGKKSTISKEFWY